MINLKSTAASLFIFFVLIASGCANFQKQAQDVPTKKYSATLFFKDTDSNEIHDSLADIINNKRNLLILKSSGGNLESAMAFYDTIKYVVHRDLTVVGVGQVSSAAVIMFCAGEKRLIGKNSYMLLHNVKTTYKEKPTENDKKEGSDQKMILELLYAEIVSETTNGKITPAQVKDMMDKSTTLTAQEVVKMGIATGLLDEESL